MAESTVVAKTNIKRQEGFRYFISGSDVVAQDRKTKDRTVVASGAFVPEKGFFYFLTADGNVAKTIRVTRGKKVIQAAA
jgi:hypothetical protein